MVLQVFASPLVALAQEAATPASPATEAVQPATENAANGEEGKQTHKLGIFRKRRFSHLNMR